MSPMQSESGKLLRIAMPCSGLGHISRGFESFMHECFHALRTDASLDVTLYKGGGRSSVGEVHVPNLRREGTPAGFLGRVTGRGPYFIEQASFLAAMLPHILFNKPDVIFFSDTAVGNALWHFRKRTHSKFALVFSNGGPSQPAFDRWDLVQQVSPEHMEHDADTNELHPNQVLLPYGFFMPKVWGAPTEQERVGLRSHLKLPLDRLIVVSIGAIQADLKRMDYVVREVARIPVGKRPFLLLLGAQEPTVSGPIKKLAMELLRESDFVVRTAPRSEVTPYLRASNIFVLASLNEGFGRVYVEALAEGLDVIAHDYETSRYVLGPHGRYYNLAQDGELARGIVSALSELNADHHDGAMRQRHEFARARFSWETLLPGYVSMMHNAFARRKSGSGIRGGHTA